jgi:hypothetical protein
VTEEVEVDRVLGAGADLAHLTVHLLGVEHGARERPEPAGGRDFPRKLPVHRARHRRLHDGELDLEQLDESAIGPHVRTLGHIAWPMPRMRRAIAPMM